MEKDSNNRLHVARAKLVSTALLVLISASAGFLGGWAGSRNKSLGFDGSNEARQQIITSESELISDIAKNVGPSVVSVSVISQENVTDFFGVDRAFEQEAAGTGVIISEEGVIVTNRHVIPAGSPTVSVTLSDGTVLDDVEVIGRTGESDPLDIAFLRVKDKKGKDLVPAKLGDSGIIQVGDKAVAIGNALGQFQNSVTSGIISGFGRSVEAGDAQGSDSLQNLLQTDAAINQGNSGGPLVNANGEVIGINTAIAAGSAENIGFAIPINDIKGLIKSVLEKGKLERPYLGIRYVTLDDNVAEVYELDTKRGAYIVPNTEGRAASILPGSPAEKAGLKEGDIITKIAGKDIDDKNSLTSLVAGYAVGEEIELTIIRGNDEQKIKVTLQAAPTN
ncbi:trypsin-like peptidase domain-containing protein [Candidatus Saccharibacteria bacterium]|nr:trypsin-like peptidase domain-containing protein [Candidatus Saccharibacteria bacterium]